MFIIPLPAAFDEQYRCTVAGRTARASPALAKNATEEG
jgi:hypothetical protein